MYDEFGNYTGQNENGGEGDDIMDQEWLNEMNQLQLDENSGDESPKVEDEEAHESLVPYQGGQLNPLISYKFPHSNRLANSFIDVNDDPEGNQIILHEDKQYYQDAEDVYKGAEILVQEEDAIPITTPIIAPVK